MPILLAYASRKGSTAEVAAFMARHLHENGQSVDLLNITDEDRPPAGYDAIVLGSGIYKGMWLPELLRWVQRHREQLSDCPVWAWALCVRVLESDGQAYVTTNYVPPRFSLLNNLQSVRFFAGRLDRERITAEELHALHERYDGDRLIHLMGDHRRWDDLRDYATQIAAQLNGTTN